MSKSVLLAGVAAAMIIGAGAAQAGTTETFDNPVVLSPTQAAGAWYTDRLAPAGFATSGGVLHEDLAASDYQGPNNFYNTQGRKLDLAPGVLSMSIDLFVSGDYVGTNGRLAGFWGSSFDAGSNLAAFPIIELTDQGGSLEFVGWDNSGAGGFFNIASADADVGSWQTLSISLDTATDLFTYTAGGVSLTSAAGGSTSIGNVILEGHNNGANLGITWDNLTTNGGAVPEPATWALMIAGFGGVGAMMRRRTVRSATA